MTGIVKNRKDVGQNGLLPCPFCGNRTAPMVIVLRGCYGGRDRYAVECDPIGAGCGVATMWKNSKTDAIDAWNRRANSEKM